MTIFQREVINIEPPKTPEDCNVSNKPERQQRNEDIYNHLNENEEHEDSDNYDHACAATFDREDPYLYSNVQRKKHNPIVPEETKFDTDDYSTVKVNTTTMKGMN